MTRCSHPTHRLATACILGALSVIGLGCSGPAAGELSYGQCRVLIDGQPAAEVRVVLAAKDSGATGLLEGVTDHLGVAEMHLLPGVQIPGRGTMELRAAVESLGDWHIAKPWSDLDKSPLQVTWPAEAGPVTIEVPKKAVKPL